jgi:hypothetical protein
MNHNFKTWEEVTDYVNLRFSMPVSQWEHIVQNRNTYPAHAFSKGQLASKAWLIDELWELWRVRIEKLPTPNPDTVIILGSWVGSLIEPLFQQFPNIRRTYGIDIDAESIAKSEKLNQKHVQNEWKYKGVVADVDNLTLNNCEFETGGELITVKPNWIINTSCEHMDNNWFNSVDEDQLLIIQSNNSEEFEGHINTCDNLDEFIQKYPLKTQLMCGELSTPAYTRFMQIGFK